ncbi:molybdate ABC transporter substrate-binding protein [Paenibacillus peoriae]|uniref:molybdate ABC transporter substrate-binding protein n=1 Tax=Paenibacillus peoriae TaxID=59893 RepID=UPI000584763D|nr:molybdate ABC transporter substrate-binding protein [Paenibacillus peoriae]MEC0183656.1 molybdate ABC transporter substrate-binding protein [Paenibacillus peoriae]
MRRIKSTIGSLVAIWALVVLVACGSQSAAPAAPVKSDAPAAQTTTENTAGTKAPDQQQVELTISAAASLTDALNEIKTGYEQEHPNVKLNFNFGASGALQRQIEQGAPADVFISASTSSMKALEGKALVKKSSTLLANDLVLVVPAKDGVAIKKLDDLKGQDIKKVAIGIPDSVPAGKYAQEVLTNQKLWSELEPKLVQAKDVRQVLQYVATGNADAGFVYKTDALSTKDTSIALTVDSKLHSPITYPLGLVAATSHEEDASQFYDYLQTEPALQVMEKYGFRKAN